MFLGAAPEQATSYATNLRAAAEAVAAATREVTTLLAGTQWVGPHRREFEDWARTVGADLATTTAELTARADQLTGIAVAQQQASRTGAIIST